MPSTDTQIQQLVVNIGTTEQIEAAIAGGLITEDMLSITTDGKTYVTSVNNEPPDSNGNVTLNALQNESSSTTSLNLMPISGGPSVNYGDNVLIRSKLTNINNRYSVGINTPFGGVAYGSIGIGANNANGGSSVAVGFGAQAGMNNSVSLGAYSHADSVNSIAIGYNAQINSSTSSSAIQIGYYNNVTQDANCLYVGFASVMKNYKLLDGTTGKIPDGRLPIATSVSSSSTNAEVVGAKLFYDTVGDIETLINAL